MERCWNSLAILQPCVARHVGQSIAIKYCATVPNHSVVEKGYRLERNGALTTDSSQRAQAALPSPENPVALNALLMSSTCRSSRQTTRVSKTQMTYQPLHERLAFAEALAGKRPDLRRVLRYHGAACAVGLSCAREHAGSPRPSAILAVIISKELRKGRKPNVFRHNVLTYALLYVEHQADSSRHSAQ